jgi:hypothetical protein
MLAQQWVRLGEAGDPQDERLALGGVGIDLPAVSWINADEASSPQAVAAAAYIVERGERVTDHGLRPGGPRHLLVVGGPGQGRSTLTQLVCQAYRVSLLQASTSLPSEAVRVRDTFAADLGAIGLTAPSHLRWPIRVELHEYAEVLAGGGEVSLLRFIADRVRRGGPYEVTASDMASWLGRWPWLLVLDGLDEVAHPRVRELVTAGVSGFLVDAAAKAAEVLVVVTTRPQGYAGEFGAADYERLDLVPLDAAAATAYAKRLTAARFQDNADLAGQVQQRLHHAVLDPDSSPQVPTFSAANRIVPPCRT